MVALKNPTKRAKSVSKKDTGLVIKQLKGLKQAGLVDIDFRKVTEKSLSNDNSLWKKVTRKVREYSAFLDGRAVTKKIESASDRTALRSRGYKVNRKGYAIIGKGKDEIVTVSKSGDITATRKVVSKGSGKEVIQKTFEPNINTKKIRTVEDFIRANKELYESTEGKRISFTYYGSISRETFGTFEEAMKKVISYEDTSNDVNEDDRNKAFSKLLKGLQIVEYIGNDPNSKESELVRKGFAKRESYFPDLKVNKKAKANLKKSLKK